MRVRVAFSSWCLALSVLGVLGACGGNAEPEEKACAPGRSIACAGEAACEGHQVCNDEGTGYGRCVCSGDETFAQAGPSSGLLGAVCVDDRDCRPGLECLVAGSTEVSGEGPSAGLCVIDCARDDSVCQKDSKCVVLDDRGTDSAADDAAYCLPSCTLGAPAPDDDKCRGRLDLVCAEDTAGTGLGTCRPVCRADLDCAGRRCDLRTGLCGDTLPEGSGIGAACDPAAPLCSGGCIEHGSAYAECSGVCRLGTPGCGQEPGADPPYDFFCYLDPSRQGAEGDLGYCARTCDCNADCDRDDAVCEPRPSLETKTGRAGVCGAKRFPTGEPRPGTPCR